MEHLPRLTLALLLALGLGAVALAEGNEARAAEKSTEAVILTKKDLPERVLKAFEKAYPKASITRVDKEATDSALCWEVESKDGATERNLSYTADGKVIEIKDGIATDSLPAPIKNAIRSKYPKGKIEKAERIVRGAVVEHEVRVKNGLGTMEVVFDSRFQILRAVKVIGEDEGDVKIEKP
jgi:hypothetical protein